LRGCATGPRKQKGSGSREGVKGRGGVHPGKAHCIAVTSRHRGSYRIVSEKKKPSKHSKGTRAQLHGRRAAGATAVGVRVPGVGIHSTDTMRLQRLPSPLCASDKNRWGGQEKRRTLCVVEVRRLECIQGSVGSIKRGKEHPPSQRRVGTA